ncbi:IS21 family transposase [Planococcus sp. CP5-4_YE]|uniref:IS21 family transposase n=1 Tax=unclassified Planococcus (in: firmicutes) TaxID=2662419 RepID=UPI001C2472E6|nr:MULTISPECIES: IS21 family transposase [unclassified Planococcus (in: firmicutes)]MBU9674210.1 IS21 family transposase [Planococcus sp. CP5-4_YE]MBV0908435.1 IS21 family transposase [Planococcus sp. CP5-4_UN]
MIYNEIHQLRSAGFTNSAIARKLKISRNRVIDYGKMTPDEFCEFILSLQNRSKKLDPYRSEIVSWLKEHPDLTGAQIFDWLEERLGVNSIAENTVRNYVNELREIYHIPKQTAERTFSAVPELPMGQQIQVDFGEKKVLTTKGTFKRLYFIGFVLAHSRFKYVEFLDRPFRASDLIHMHENAFRHFGGMSQEIVYDQDRLLMVSENSGDLIMTAEFTKYQQTRKFKVYLCRKSDPQSKGKIEQVVKYVKNNFMKNRTFDNLMEWQGDCMKWLERTGNKKVHHNIKKRPFEVHALEKQHLQKISGTYIFEKVFTSSITRDIQHDNVIRFEANRYSVPRGTYRKGAPNIAYIQTDNDYLYIRLQEHGEILAKHSLATGKGSVISDPSHRERDQTKRELLIQQIQSQLTATKTSTWFIEELTERYPRHLIDQLKVVQSVIGNYPDFVDEALEEVKRLKLMSANDLRDIAISLEIDSQKQQKKVGTINEKYKDIVAPERTTDIYLSVLRGGKNR